MPTARLRSRRLRAMLAAALLAPLLLPAAAPAAPKAKDVRWRIVQVKLDGYSMYRLDDGDYRYALDGRVKYRTAKGKTLKGKPFAVKPGAPAVAQVRGGIDWSTTNTSTIAGERGSWSCPYARAGDAGLAGVVVVRGTRVHVQWSLAPAYRQCPQDAPIWSFDALPAKAMTTSFKRNQLDARRRRVKVYTDLQHRWTDSGGTQSEVHWDGYVVFERVTR